MQPHHFIIVPFVKLYCLTYRLCFHAHFIMLFIFIGQNNNDIFHCSFSFMITIKCPIIQFMIIHFWCIFIVSDVSTKALTFKTSKTCRIQSKVKWNALPFWVNDKPSSFVISVYEIKKLITDSSISTSHCGYFHSRLPFTNCLWQLAKGLLWHHNLSALMKKIIQPPRVRRTSFYCVDCCVD